MPKMHPFEISRSIYVLIRSAKEGRGPEYDFSEAEISQYLEVERAYEAMQTMITERIGRK
jgi:hypothetical protein